MTFTISQEYRKPVAIVSEQRYLSGDGKFGAAYSQEDGINFKEETDSDGTRHGSYSYVDPTGQRRTISYTAGKNGYILIDILQLPYFRVKLHNLNRVWHICNG